MILVHLSISYSSKIDVAFDAACPLINATLDLEEQMEVSYNSCRNSNVCTAASTKAMVLIRMGLK